MNVGYAKFQKKFDSRTISRELPQGCQSNVKLVTDENKYRDSFVVCMIADISLFHSTKHVWPTIDRMFV